VVANTRIDFLYFQRGDLTPGFYELKLRNKGINSQCMPLHSKIFYFIFHKALRYGEGSIAKFGIGSCLEKLGIRRFDTDRGFVGE